MAKAPTEEECEQVVAEAVVHEDVRPEDGERLERRAHVRRDAEQRDGQRRQPHLQRLTEERGRLEHHKDCRDRHHHVVRRRLAFRSRLLRWRAVASVAERQTRAARVFC